MYVKGLFHVILFEALNPELNHHLFYYFITLRYVLFSIFEEKGTSTSLFSF